MNGDARDGMTRKGKPREIGVGDTLQTNGSRVELSWVEAIALLLRRLRSIAVFTLAFAMIATAYAVIRVRYSAQSSFSPEAASTDLSRLSGLAGQLGFNVLPPGGDQSVEFYGELLQSNGLLKDAVMTTYDGAEETAAATQTLVQWYGVKGKTQEERVQKAIEKLRRNLNVNTDIAANLVKLRTTSRSRRMAVAINARLLELVNQFNLDSRRTKAAAERAFLERRVAAARDDLDAAERQMEDFLNENQSIVAPRLQFEHARLQRRITLRGQVYSELSNALEQARIAEVRNTPVISIVDRPEGSGQRAGLRWPMAALVGGFLGLLMGIVFAFVAEYFNRERQLHPDDYRMLHAAVQAHLPHRFGAGRRGR